jgi:hypothetical protein
MMMIQPLDAWRRTRVPDLLQSILLVHTFRFWQISHRLDFLDRPAHTPAVRCRHQSRTVCCGMCDACAVRPGAAPVSETIRLTMALNTSSSEEDEDSSVVFDVGLAVSALILFVVLFTSFTSAGKEPLFPEETLTP